MRYSLLACSLALFVVACGDDKSSDGGTPPITPEPTGETCADPFAGAAGTVSGDSTDMADDIALPCGPSTGAVGADVVYALSLAEESGVVISASGYDLILGLLGASCTPVSDDACSDLWVTDPEELRFPVLPAGDYFIVVDSYGTTDAPGTGGSFSLTVEVSGPFCDPDAHEPNEVADGSATYLGTGDTTVSTDNLCPATDADIFLVGHMGGSFAANLTGSSVSGSLRHAVVSGEPPTITPGAAVGSLPHDADAARGLYFIEVTGSSVPTTGTPYTLAVSHLCGGDDSDFPIAPYDDEQLRYAPLITQPISGGLPRNICGEDADGFVVYAAVDGNVVVSFADAVSGGEIPVSITVYQVTGALGAEPVVTPLAEVTDYTVAPGANGLEVTIPATAGERFLVVASGPTGAIDYVVNADFAELATPPPNDACSGAIALTGGVAVQGQTLSATHHISGACNAEEDVPANSVVGPAGDLFYTLHLTEVTDVQLQLDGRVTDFYGSLYMFALPGGTCPADLTTLQEVVDPATTAPQCGAGSNVRLRAPRLAAGDYLVVVDGYYYPAIDFLGIPEEKTAGAFTLTPTLYTAGFPEPSACISGQVAAIPTAGAPVTLRLNNTFEGNDFTDWGDCSEGGSGNEVGFRLEPAANVNVTITTGGIDTILAVIAGSCPGATPTACNDDIDFDAGDYASSLTTSLVGGTVYYVVVDGYYDSEYGPIDVTIELAN